jgi:formyltetrahydrofolate deformylase
MTTHILKVACRDAKGLVHRITGVLFRRGLNIVENGEFVDREAGRFFMRTEFTGRPDPAIAGLVRREVGPSGSVALSENRKKNIVVFATREAHCLGDLLIRHAFGDLHANLLAVVSNRDVLGGLTAAFRLPFHHLPHERKSRRAHEDAVLRVTDRYRPDYLVLAKYMRILSGRFVRRFANRIVNIHHSFLPAFTGARPYLQAARRGVKIIGATAHFVTEDLDRGPIIAQAVASVDHSHSAEDMAQAGRDVEKAVLARALKLTFEDRIFVHQNRTVIFD